jgi:hypothetical protein
VRLDHLLLRRIPLRDQHPLGLASDLLITFDAMEWAGHRSQSHGDDGLVAQVVRAHA